MTLATEHPRTASVDGPVTPTRAAAAARAFSALPTGGYPHPVPAATAEYRLRAEAHQVVGDRRADDLMVAAAARPGRSCADVCAALVDRTERWAATEHVESRTGVLHIEALGQLIDRMAAIWMRGRLLADAHVTPTEPAVRVVASPQLRALGRSRFPALQTPTGSNGMA
jgi:hypothetical protein